MLWGLIIQALILVQEVMGMLVNVSYHFNRAADTQWNLQSLTYSVTPKGESVISALATIIHMGLDFVAQFTLLLPAVSSVTYTFN